MNRKLRILNFHESRIAYSLAQTLDITQSHDFDNILYIKVNVVALASVIVNIYLNFLKP